MRLVVRVVDARAAARVLAGMRRVAVAAACPTSGSPPGWRAPAPKSAMIPAMIAPSSGRKTIAEYTALSPSSC